MLEKLFDLTAHGTVSDADTILGLEAGAQQISGGDYRVTLPVRSRDEFGDLTVAFNEMSRNLAIKEDLIAEQRRENDNLLLSLMPEQVVQRYREGEQTIAQDHQDVTVIFADVVGLDELSDELPSEETATAARGPWPHPASAS